MDHAVTDPMQPERREWSRRQALLLGGGVVAGAALAACGGGASPPATSKLKAATTARYHSQPGLKPPLFEVTQGTTSPASGYIFVTPSGPIILDNAGQPVWIHPVSVAATNFQVQAFKGEPVLTWWEGTIAPYGVGLSGEFVSWTPPTPR